MCLLPYEDTGHIRLIAAWPCLVIPTAAVFSPSQTEIVGFRNSPYLSGRRDTTDPLTNLEFIVPCFKSQQYPFLPVVSFGNGDLHFPYDDVPYSLLERS